MSLIKALLRLEVWFTALQAPQEKPGISYIPIMSSMEPHGEPQSYYHLSRIDLNL